MQVAFIQTSEDIVALDHFFILRMPGRRKSKVFAAVMYALPLIIVSGLLAMVIDSAIAANGPKAIQQSSLIFFLSWPLAVAVGLTGYLAWSQSAAASRWRVARRVRRRKISARFLGPKSISIDREGYRVTGDGFETFLAWRHLPRVYVDLEHLFLCHTFSASALSAEVIPASAFPDANAFVQFCDAAEAFWKDAL